MSAQTQRRRSANGNSNAHPGGELAAALASEQQIAVEAAAVRGDTVGLDRELFIKLLPILRKPIPQGFIKTIGVVTGKPYASTGVTSVQVQINRMDNVLTPLGWEYSDDYLEEGKVAIVTVRVLDREGNTLAERSSRGGVDRASTSGNLYKGSFTNAAKLAFARLGVGHEVYIGATDLDPDVDADVAKAQANPGGRGTGAAAPTTGGDAPLGSDAHEKIRQAFRDAGINDDDFGLYLTAVDAAALDQVTASQAYRLRELLDAQIERTTGGSK